MSNWINETFKTSRPIIGLVHLKAFPGSANYKKENSIEELTKQAIKDYHNLVEGGISAVCFCDEFDKPYYKQAKPHSIAIMTAIIKEVLAHEKRIPFGVDLQWDPKAALAVAKAVDADFIRGIVVGTYCGDYGFYSVDVEDLLTYKHLIKADNIKIITNLCPEFSYSLDKRPATLRAQTAFKSSLVDAICVSGTMAGTGVPIDCLREVKEAVGDCAVFANTGTNFDTVKEILDTVDGCFVATCIKKDGKSENEIDIERVKKIVAKSKGE